MKKTEEDGGTSSAGDVVCNVYFLFTKRTCLYYEEYFAEQEPGTYSGKDFLSFLPTEV